jgi:AraC-like DNA-binding protein
MSLALNYITVDNPNIPVLDANVVSDTPYGRLTATKSEPSFDPSLAEIKMSDMYLPNVSLRSIEGKFSENALFYNQRALGTELLGSCVFYKGRIQSYLKDSTDYIESFNHSHNFKYDPSNEFRHFVKGNSELHFIHFSYTTDFLSQFLPENEEWSDVLKSRLVTRERVVGKKFAAISTAQEQALRNILDCPLDGKLGYMLIETSVVQVILLQMYALFNPEAEIKPKATNKRDMEVIYSVKEYLTKKFLDDHSLQNLAKEFGTNTNKLMSLFKKTFGKSIFEFIGEMRMDHAMKLLCDERLLVTEVAGTLGYKNPNHFSSAFKRKFGICPSGFKSKNFKFSNF